MRQAFTLVEILIVISIIATLTAILIPTAGMVRESARATMTASRMQDILTTLTTLDAASSAARTVQREASLGGVVDLVDKSPEMRQWLIGQDLRRNNVQYKEMLVNSPVAAIDTQWFTQADYDAAHIFGHPWEHPDRIGARSAMVAGYAGQIRETSPIDSAGLQLASIADLSAAKSFLLLRAARVFEDVDDADAAYRSDRTPSRRWNDAWGRPLVISYGIFQPPPADITETSNSETRTWKDGVRAQLASQQYGFSRSIYLVIAASGPVLPAALSEADLANASEPAWSATVLPGLWTQAADVCGAAAWTGAAFSTPPWSGIKQAKAGGRRSLLSAPITLR